MRYVTRKINILDVESDFSSVLWTPIALKKKHVNVEYQILSSAILNEVHDACVFLFL